MLDREVEELSIGFAEIAIFAVAIAWIPGFSPGV